MGKQASIVHLSEEWISPAKRVVKGRTRDLLCAYATDDERDKWFLKTF